MKRNVVMTYAFIVFGSFIYAVGTCLFIFPHGLLLGGTSGISVILNSFLPFSPGKILMAINLSLLIAAIFVLGKGMAVKTFVGSTLTTVFIGILDGVIPQNRVIIQNVWVCMIVGSVIIAVASAILFYVDASSGGTDIIALIIRKYSKIDIGKALLISDFLIVVAGGLLSGLVIGICSMAGLLIKTFGIDFFINLIRKLTKSSK